ncbi:MAG: hypothetical protein NTW21_14335 [Verrucomicrobia bacterium]|nr:hypothetical protein [Verrucomicrobiota bacterium]
MDNHPAEKPQVVRLGEEAQPVRLIPENRDSRLAPAARLEMPNTEDLDSRRTHEPGLDALIETEVASLLAAEANWDKSAAERSPLPWGWFALVGLLLAGAVGWSVSHIRRADKQVGEEHQQAAVMANASVASERELEQMFERMEEMVKTFCEATSLKTMLPLVRHPARVRPLMDQFYGQRPPQPLGFRQVLDVQGAALESTSDFWAFAVVLGDGRTKNILVEHEVSGKILVDWETAVTYQPMNWDNYALQRPQGTMDFRVFVEEDHFFSHEFANSNRWVSFRLTAPDSEETLFGYAAKDGPVAAALLAMIQGNDTRQVAVILRLALPPGMQSRRGVIIDKVANARWIYVNPPDSDS